MTVLLRYENNSRASEALRLTYGALRSLGCQTGPSVGLAMAHLADWAACRSDMVTNTKTTYYPFLHFDLMYGKPNWKRGV